MRNDKRCAKQTIEETGHSLVEETMGPILSIMSEAQNSFLLSRYSPIVLLNFELLKV